MKFYLIRHAHALGREEARVETDAARPLSPRGEAQAKEAGKYLESRGARPAAIFTSPLLRARQTAETVAGALDLINGVRVMEGLKGELDAEALWETLHPELFSLQAPEAAAVGHQPRLSEIVAALSGRMVDFAPSSIACLEVGSDRRATFLWLKA